MAATMRPAVVETHLSTLFFYRDCVVKVRRPVSHRVADFRSLERRRASCEREVALNRRLAPDVYLGTATITVEGTPSEYAVVMRRLESQRNLAAVAARMHDVIGGPEGGPEESLEEDMGRVAAVLARFHAGADRSPRIDAAATGSALWQRWQAVEEAMEPFVGPVVDAGRYRRLTALARQYLEGRDPLLRRRITEGAVCDGHGNLESADVFLLDDEPRILDRLELDEEGRYGDVLADVASLAQDLEVLGAGAAADALLAAYRRCSGREQPPSLVHFYVAQRAHVRMLAQCLRQRDQGSAARTPGGSAQGPDAGPDAGLPAGVSPEVLLDQAIGRLQAALPQLVLVGGPPRSGRSTLAAWMGSRLGADVLSAPPGRTGRGQSVARRGACERMCEQAGQLLATGRSVVLDAAWSTVAERRMAEDAARRWGAHLVSLHCRRGPDAHQSSWPEALVAETSPPGEPPGEPPGDPERPAPAPGAAKERKHAGPRGRQPLTTVVPARPSRRS